MTLEAFLARVYTDTAARDAFLRDPAGEALRAGVPQSIAASIGASMGDIDAAGVVATAEGLARKGRGPDSARLRRNDHPSEDAYDQWAVPRRSITSSDPPPAASTTSASGSPRAPHR